ncbi:hypothetical protein [Frankia sp. AgW1.1]|uniref:hypothetical protein n=1 Tax=Frankia sp. AgW1.1 TaxID=1836971 RepID=UPI0019311B1A|nr:hypothetical protein [Frankia sp. AgW1.1]MBL7489012.1 hypothetical protein [Frankia sp. AgW1.1]
MDGNPAEPAGPGDAGHEPDPRWPAQAQQTGGYGFPYPPLPPTEVDGGFSPSDTSPIPLGPLYLQTPYRDPADDPSMSAGPGGQQYPYQSAGPRGYLPAGTQPPYPPGGAPPPGGPTGPPTGENWANWFAQPEPGYGPPSAEPPPAAPVASPWRQPAQPSPWDQPLANPAYPGGYPQPPAYPPPTDAGGGFVPTDATSAIPITAFRESLPPAPGQPPPAQYPTAQYPTTQYPTAGYPAQYPAAGYPVDQYPEAQYPATEQYAQPPYSTPQYPLDQPAAPGQPPTTQYPAGQYPTAQYPVGQYPTGQYPTPLYQAGTFPAAPYQDPLTLGAYGQDALYPGHLGQYQPPVDPRQPASDVQQARYPQPPAEAGPFPGLVQPAAPDVFAPYYQPPPTDVASGGFAPSDTSAIPITAFRESLAAGAPRPQTTQRRITKPVAASSTAVLPAADGEKAPASAPPAKHGVRRARLRRRRQRAGGAALGVVIVAVATALVLRLVDGGDATTASATPTFAVGGAQGSAKSYPFPVFALTRSAPPGTSSMSPGGALGAAVGTAGSGAAGTGQLVLTPVAPTPATPPVAAHT